MNRVRPAAGRTSRNLALVAPRARRERLASLVDNALAAYARRERLVITLLLIERLRPVEVAVALGLSLRHVERTAAVVLAELDRIARRAPLPARTRRAA